ncbi:hypothetical protein B0H14DRAFT_2562799 [Mycena olivaceomarginata]|nr:hypothetical protein B0H14DRAFT_2562799 [Mycena olivaceomarginata]
MVLVVVLVIRSRRLLRHDGPQQQVVAQIPFDADLFVLDFWIRRQVHAVQIPETSCRENQTTLSVIHREFSTSQFPLGTPPSKLNHEDFKDQTFNSYYQIPQVAVQINAYQLWILPAVGMDLLTSTRNVQSSPNVYFIYVPTPPNSTTHSNHGRFHLCVPQLSSHLVILTLQSSADTGNLCPNRRKNRQLPVRNAPRRVLATTMVRYTGTFNGTRIERMAHGSHRFPDTFTVLTDSLPTVRTQPLAQERAQKAWCETAEHAAPSPPPPIIPRSPYVAHPPLSAIIATPPSTDMSCICGFH